MTKKAKKQQFWQRWQLFMVISAVVVVMGTFVWVWRVEAGRGCCSSHGGQSYCGGDGYWYCGDGTRSPTCKCDGGGSSGNSGATTKSANSSTKTVTKATPAPKKVVPAIPDSTKLEWKLVYNGGKSNTCDVIVSWNRSNADFSLALSKKQGANPGPKADTTTANYTFAKIKPGTWYFNLKEKMNGDWSQVKSWKIKFELKDCQGYSVINQK